MIWLYLFALAQCALLQAAPADTDSMVLLKPFLKVSLLELELDPYGAADESSLTYEPNVSPDFGLALEIGDFEVSASLPLSMDEEELRTKGRTRSQDYNISLLRQEWGTQIGFQKYKGFYSDLGDVSGDEISSADLLRNPSLSREGYYGRILWFPQFLLFSQSDIIATPLLGVSIDVLHMATDSSLIPENQFALYGDDVELRGAAMETYSALFGGRGKISRGSWEGGMLIYFGRGAQYRILRFEDEDRMAGWHNAGKFGLHFESSYKFGRLVSGLEMLLDISELKLANSMMESTLGNVIVSLGTLL